jgi:hypothetical protein
MSTKFRHFLPTTRGRRLTSALWRVFIREKRGRVNGRGIGCNRASGKPGGRWKHGPLLVRTSRRLLDESAAAAAAAAADAG